VAKLPGEGYAFLQEPTMKVVIRFTARQEAKAMPLLFRHSPGMILPERTYIVNEDAVRMLRRHGVKFTDISREGDSTEVEGTLSGERI
jgi:hypothetical protein